MWRGLLNPDFDPHFDDQLGMYGNWQSKSMRSISLRLYLPLTLRGRVAWCSKRACIMRKLGYNGCQWVLEQIRLGPEERTAEAIWQKRPGCL